MKKHVKKLSILVVVMVLILVSLILLLKKSKTDVSRHPGNNYNVVLIVADALRRDVLGCYGGDTRTPNIDWLAQNGVMFENAYSTAPCTLPSSVSMLTGNYSRAYGIILADESKKQLTRYSFYVNDNETLLAEVLKEIGYDTFMDIENPMAARSNNLQGFSKFRTKGQMNFEEINRVEDAIGLKDIDSEAYPISLRKYYWRMYDLLYYLLTVPDDQNFFILKWFLDPHAPYDPAVKFKENISYDSAKLPKKAAFYTESFVKELRKANKEKNLSGYEYLYLKALYKAEVESVDERVGYIVKALQLKGLLNKTFIVFTSDHGELFGEHGGIAHGEYFNEPLVHIPLIIAGPGIPKGKREKTVVSHLDLIPTLKDLLKVNYADNMKGKSYKALFTGEPFPDRTPYIDRISNDIRKKPGSDALIARGYKLIVTEADNRYVIKLFNLVADPGETKDISRENKPLVREMFKKILDLRKDNNIRLKQNAARIGKDADLNKEYQKTMEELKSLGYL